MSGSGFQDNYLRGVQKIEEHMARRRAHRTGVRGKERLLQAEIDQGQVAILRDEVEELKLVVAALLNTLVSKGVVSDAQLLEEAMTIDEMDGRADGKLHGTVEADGTVTPAPLPERTALDDLADATEDR